MDSLLHLPVFCCKAVPLPHWVPDSQLQQCSSCGDAFNPFVRRHHCRCCGSIFCDACSSGRVVLPGFGYLSSVRVCDDCRQFELGQLPLLLAGDVWTKVGEPQQRYLRLSPDQSLLVWTPWRLEEGPLRYSTEDSADVARLTCVSEAPEQRELILWIDSERLTFVADDPKQVHLWAAALSRLLAIIRQRHSYEQLFGGIAAGAESPRTLAVRLPLMDQLLEQRANALMDSKQRALIAQEMQKRQGTNTALGNTNSARHSEQLSS
ncbi:hypothetical protein AB1Y20_000399 [Prymnesium parvum]|uniref:FYVE-type domain-containing protein n=1 Tax=Prymnesium parvum TaxID=97485 RepID=A0AB34K802_PRYPA